MHGHVSSLIKSKLATTEEELEPKYRSIVLGSWIFGSNRPPLIKARIINMDFPSMNRIVGGDAHHQQNNENTPDDYAFNLSLS